MSVKTDEYEELLSILDEISLREFSTLHKLMVFEEVHPLQGGKSILNNAKEYWGEYKQKIIQELELPHESFNAFMAKTERTGLYNRITGNYYDYSGDIGKTTPLLNRLIDLVKLES